MAGGYEAFDDPYCYQGTSVLKNEGGARFRGLTPEEFTTRLARFLAELNAIHPFREGNGRTQLSFVSLISAEFGQPLEMTRIDPEAFLRAMVVSFAGELEPLTAELRLLRKQFDPDGPG